MKKEFKKKLLKSFADFKGRSMTNDERQILLVNQYIHLMRQHTQRGIRDLMSVKKILFISLAFLFLCACGNDGGPTGTPVYPPTISYLSYQDSPQSVTTGTTFLIGFYVADLDMDVTTASVEVYNPTMTSIVNTITVPLSAMTYTYEHYWITVETPTVTGFYPWDVYVTDSNGLS